MPMRDGCGSLIAGLVAAGGDGVDAEGACVDAEVEVEGWVCAGLGFEELGFEDGPGSLAEIGVDVIRVPIRIPGLYRVC